MAFIDLFLKTFAMSKMAKRKESVTGKVVAYHSSGLVAQSPRDTVSLTPSGFTGNPIGFSTSEMELQKTKESAVHKITIAFGVPPMISSIPGEANYQESKRDLYR